MYQRNKITMTIKTKPIKTMLGRLEKKYTRMKENNVGEIRKKYTRMKEKSWIEYKLNSKVELNKKIWTEYKLNSKVELNINLNKKLNWK